MLMHQGDTPVTIPNTEVKPLMVDDTGTIGAGKVDWRHYIYDWFDIETICM